MGRVINDADVDFNEEEKDYIFFLNEEKAPTGCVGYWCEWCYFSSAFRRYFQVDHIIPVAGAAKYGVGPDFIRSVDNACVLCVACNSSKNKYGFPRDGVGLAYRIPNQNMTWGSRRAAHLDWDDLILMCKRKGRFRRQE
jgi:5-methylcytosine-specific restriction endonuclease McrA